MSAEQVIEHLKQMDHEDMDVILIEGEPFWVKRATPDDIEDVKESNLIYRHNANDI